jgi:predicted dienelactone hydrolase
MVGAYGVTISSQPRTWNVGAMHRQFAAPEPYNWRGSKTHALVTTIWYPTPAANPRPHDAGPPNSPPIFQLGEWTDDAPPADGSFPLIVLSHGTGGSAETLAWLAVPLAAHGYIVVGVNHPGNNALEPYTAEGFLEWWERANDLSVVIDRMGEDRTFAKRIDPRRIGAAGFSLGGLASIALVGGRTDPALYREYCRRPDAEGCGEPPEFPGLFAKWTDMEAHDARYQAAAKNASNTYRDDRIQAAFAIAPALGQSFVESSLRTIYKPVAIVAGEGDTLVPPRSNAQRLHELIPNSQLTILPGGVGHYTFLASCTDQGRSAQPAMCTDAAGVDRDAVHRKTADEAIRFFDERLNAGGFGARPSDKTSF